jgi:hypothetical protein
MERRFPRIQRYRQASVSPVPANGECMEPKSPIKSSDMPETLLPTVLCPVDAEDYFELAYEADEFGVHVPHHSDDE